jgi:hypothetical protein
MARFYGSVKGSRSEATKTGSKASGIEGHIRGWDFGVRVRCYVNKDGEDECEVSLTGGSNGYKGDVVLGTFSEKDLN